MHCQLASPLGLPPLGAPPAAGGLAPAQLLIPDVGPSLAAPAAAGTKAALEAGLAAGAADVWGFCPGAPILASVFRACNEPSQARCEADSRCSWSAARDPLNPLMRPCLIKPEALPAFLLNITSELQAAVKSSSMAMDE
jgi:hypothetical protein